MSSAKPTFFADARKFRKWLATHGATATELVVGFHKVDSGRPSMTWSESVDEALCYGWIDGVRKRIDDDAYQIRFTPRRSGSNWSAINIAKFDRLEAEGRMTESGRKAFGKRLEAKSRIYAYEQERSAELTAAETRDFERDRVAWRYFASTPPGYRKVMLHWITSAKRGETRASRLAKLVEACRAGNRLR